MRPRERIDNVERVIRAPLRVAALAETGESGNRDCRNAAISIRGGLQAICSALRKTKRLNLIAESCVLILLQTSQAVVAQAKLIDQARRENMIVNKRRVLKALGLRCSESRNGARSIVVAVIKLVSAVKIILRADYLVDPTGELIEGRSRRLGIDKVQ